LPLPRARDQSEQAAEQPQRKVNDGIRQRRVLIFHPPPLSINSFAPWGHHSRQKPHHDQPDDAKFERLSQTIRGRARRYAAHIAKRGRKGAADSF
jgi:hypothetical protein